ncbi:DUF3078 domain-containing protein [soil metagenome]
MIKKSTLLFTALLFISLHANAQETIVVSDTLVGWDYGWVTGLNGSQASYSNWSQGGVNNIAATGSSTFRAYYRENRYSCGFLINTRYGQTRFEDDGSRKTDDRLSIRNRFQYDLGEEGSDFSLYADVNFRTQFAEGYDYGAGPDGEDILISNFLAPAYFSQNAGLAYSPGEQFSFQAGIGLRQTIVREPELVTLYGLEEGETVRNEAGVNLGASYEHTISTNLVLSSTLETFTNVGGPLTSTDINFSNEIVGRINNLMNASVRLDLVYDDDFSNEIQMRQSLSLGISFILL